MAKNIQILGQIFKKVTKVIQIRRCRTILVMLSGLLSLSLQEARSAEIFLKCTGKFEINRGALIKPDWETSYLTINLYGLKSTIINKGIISKGSTRINGNSYTITDRDNKNRVINIHKINETHGTYMVEFPQENRILIGTCQKGKG